MMRMLTRDERLDWLQLARTGGVGPRTFTKLLSRFETPRRALRELPRLAAETGARDRYHPFSRAEAEAELEAIENAGWDLVTRADAAYPSRLREIPDPPPVFTVRGCTSVLTAPAVAVVGARNASGNGRAFAKSLARDLAAEGLVVVSGLARGIDGAAHEGALAAEGVTVAALASGLDVPYPPEHTDLLARLAETGAGISERPMGAEPQARHFPKRNRLIAGLSIGVVVVEAAPHSGSLITAHLAADLGREVMAVPGSPLDPRHRGTNQLLREGATLVESAADVTAVLAPQLEGMPLPLRPRRSRTEARPKATAREPAGRWAEGAGDRAAPGSVSSMPARPLGVAGPDVGAVSSDQDDVSRRVCACLGPEPLLVDELIRQCSAPTSAVQNALLELELEGRITRHPGGRVALALG